MIPGLRDMRAPAWPALPRLSAIKNLIRILLPSFIADLIWPELRPTFKLHPTSYLDGLRGIAAFLVFFCHYTEENHPYLVPTYGLNLKGEPAPSSFLQLPFLRIIFSGRPMVHIFFVVSGFALSFKPLKGIHARSLEKCYSALASSVFRRPFRLFGPCIVSTFIVLLLAQWGYMHMRPQPWWDVFVLWKKALFEAITWPWSWDNDLRPAFDIHLWTIPIEFVHSMLLFLVILMLSRVRLRIRQGATFFLMIYSLCCGKWASFEFLTGMFLAEIHILKSATKGPWANEQPGSSRRMLFLRKSFFMFVVVAAIFIGGWPNIDADKTPIISTLFAHTPSPFAEMGGELPQKFWFAISAAFLVQACGELVWFRRFLEGPFAQYCGHLSYAIYICHGPVLIVCERRGWIGLPSAPASGTPGQDDYKPPFEGFGVRYYFPGDDPFQRTLCWAAGMMVIGPVAVWAADVFWRLVDVPIIAFARKVENYCLDVMAEQQTLPQTREREREDRDHHPMVAISVS